MRANRFLLLAFVLLSVLAVADTQNDPRIIIQPGGGSTPVYGLNFSFSLSGPDCTQTAATSDTTGNFQCEFINESGQDWSSLRLDLTPAGQLPLNCDGGSYYANCTPDSEGGTSVLFFNGSIPSQIIFYGPVFSSANDPQANPDFMLVFEGFDVTTGVTGAANVPEPGTLALLGSGLVGLIALRKRAS